MDILVSTEWLADQIGRRDLRILDATYFALEPDRDAASNFAAGHIPGARFLDLEHLADPGSPLPSMAPSAAMIEARFALLGVSASDRIVLYDDAPHKTAARAWWLLRLFGAKQVAILDGGLAKWRGEGRAIETGDAAPAPSARFVAQPEPALVRSKRDVLAIVEGEGGAQLLDARSPARFSGEEADPRPGVEPGHIPGSLNLRYGALFGPDGTWKRDDALKTAFESAGVDLDRPVVTTCGSGITAAILLFGLALLGKGDVSLYDGSWSEWGADPATPKETGR